MVVQGKLIKCNRTAKTFKGVEGKEKLYITLSDVDISPEHMMELQDAFKESGKKFTPAWITDFEGYVNVSTTYALPVKDPNGKEHDSIEEAIANGLDVHGAEVQLALNVKSGAVYPKALKMLTFGEPYDAFADFE